MWGSQIRGTGSAFPEKSLDNKYFETFLETSDAWIQARTGIKTRRIADKKKGETTTTLALAAARKAVEKAELSAQDIGAIIVGTVTPDTVMPSTANQVQAALGNRHAFCFDLQAACSGWLYSMAIADQFIRSGQVEHALVIGVETLSTIVNWQDRGTAILFGDGAGATVLSRTEDPLRRVLATQLYADGEQGCHLHIPHGYAAVPTYSAEYREDQHKIIMKGNEIFKLAVRAMSSCTESILTKHQLSVADIDLFIFHQANIRILEMIAKQLEIPKEKLWVNVDKYGNTSAATLPVSLDESMRSGMAKKGDLVLFSTFGGGATWGSALARL